MDTRLTAMDGDMGRRDITLINPYYDNPRMFELQQEQWGDHYPEHLRKHFHAIVVDDCSPRWPALPHVREELVKSIASFKLFKTLVDVRWNWLFCRNLAAAKATTEWILMTDIDHMIPTETLDYITGEKLNPRTVYKFSRCNAPNLDPYKAHPNTWMMTVEMFDQIGGYDERFSGHYGTDADFRERVNKNAATVQLDLMTIRYPREVIADASTTTYGRKGVMLDGSRDEVDDAGAVALIRSRRNLITDWRPKRLTFPYELQFEC